MVRYIYIKESSGGDKSWAAWESPGVTGPCGENAGETHALARCVCGCVSKGQKKRHMGRSER